MGKKAENLTYDVMGQVILKKQCIEGRTYAMGFGYDQLGRLKSLTYPNQEVVTYQYDSAGRLHYMSGYVNSMSYDAEGNLTGVEYSNQTKATFRYDPERQWLKRSTLSKGNKMLYQAGYDGYFANGLIQITHSSTNEMNLTFSYDDLNRLTGVSGDLSQTFQYDVLGNMIYNSQVGTYAYLGTVAGMGCGTVVTTISSCPHAVKSTSSTQISQEFEVRCKRESDFGQTKGLQQAEATLDPVECR